MEEGECSTGEHPRYRGATTPKVFYLLMALKVMHEELVLATKNFRKVLDVGLCAINMCARIQAQG